MVGLASVFGPGARRPGAPVEHYLWPDNVQAWGVWLDVQTQWREGASGPTGLDYAGVRAWIDELGVHGSERRELWAGLQACERAVLDVWRQREQQRQQDRQRQLQPAGAPG